MIGTIIIFLLIFFVIVMGHEFGHFLIAKVNGIRVNEFAIGMGPKIAGFKKGETEYALRAFPLGGACIFEGEDGLEAAKEEASAAGTPADKTGRGALQNVPVDLVEAARIDGATSSQILFKIKIPMVMPSVTICTFLTLTNSFKLFDQNLSLTAGEPAKQSMMLAYNIYDTFYARSGPQWKGIGQAKAVVFFLFVVVISLLQLHFTRSKEVQA